MRLLVTVAAALAVIIGCVLAEQCTVDGDCGTTTCAGGNKVICQHPDGAGVVTNGGLCTCSDTVTGECINKEECYGNSSTLNCPDSQRHCYDNRCICDRFPIGRR